MKNTTRTMVMALLCAATVAMTSCGKGGSNSTGGSSSPSSFLTTGVWHLQKYEYMKKDGTWIPDPDAKSMTAQTLTFNASGSFAEFYSGSSTGTWKLSADNSQLTLTGGAGVAFAYNVNQLSLSILQLTIPDFSKVDPTYVQERVTYVQ